jgi:hypothetical protein
MTRKKRPRLPDVILSLMWDILLRICSTKNAELISAYFLPGVAAPTESTASITTEFPLLTNANLLISQKTYLAEPDSVPTAMT